MRYRRLLLRSVPLAAAAATLGVAAPAGAAVTACPSAANTPSAENVQQVERTVLCLVNRERTSRGLKRLRANGKLAEAAVSHSQDMVRREYFDHVSPGGATPLQRIKATGWLRGGRSYAYGENLAWGSGDLANPAHIVENWMHSPGHRRNILTPGFDEIGVGIALGTPRAYDGATYTTTFGAKR